MINKFLILFLFPASFMLKAQNTSAIDQLMLPYKEGPGAALAIVKNGKIIYKKNYGMAALEKDRRVTSATNFRLASVSKAFTAAAVLQLKERGKLSLDIKLTDIFEGFPEFGITVKHLLSHTSGLQDYENFVSDTALTNQVKDKDVLEIVKRLDSTYFPAGTQFRYSNTGYALLALVVEKFSAMSFASYLSENIFRPLRMNNTVAYEKGISDVKNRAYGYARDKEGHWFMKDQNPYSAVLGDGGIYSSINDMLKWDQSLYSGKVLSLPVIEEAFTPNYTSSGEIIGYGFGWRLKTNSAGEKVTYHPGSTSGFLNVFYRVPAKKFSLILLTNRSAGNPMPMADLAEKIMEACGCLE
ncbi:MAG: serine hydrolase domain-containing protein [Niabella sp.]